jgi:hypothetical protein
MEAFVPEDPYQRLYASQGGACAICERKHVLLRVDYSRGKPRGLLCARCRLAVGYLQEDPRLAHQIRAYLHRDGATEM